MKKTVVRVTSSAMVAATLFSTVALAGTANAQKAWVARKPQEIQIVNGQKEYTIQWGDTLWAISQKTNITISKLAQINNIGDVNFIMTGNKLVLNWDSNGNATATVVNQNGSVQSTSTITNQDKVDPSQQVGTTVSDQAVANAETKTPSTNAVTPNTNGTTPSNNTNNNTNNNGGNVTPQPAPKPNPTPTPDPKPAPQPTPTPTPTDKVLGVPFVSQGSTMLCEGSSLLEALQYKGHTSEGLYTFVNTMPISPNNNPYNGYAGEWRHNVDGTYQGMMSAPVIQWAAKYGSTATDISGQGISGIKQSIINGNPVVAWITYNYEAPQFKQMSWGRAVWNGHVVNVDGFKPGYLHVVDPVFGARWINETTFANSFNTTGMAVSVG